MCSSVAHSVPKLSEAAIARGDRYYFAVHFDAEDGDASRAAAWEPRRVPSESPKVGQRRALWTSRSARVEVAIVAGLTLLAAALRLWQLDTVPLGLHGDEAWTGIDARRIVEERWIGPYLISALGQPIGPAYWTALLFSFLPDTTMVLRLSMAVFGVLTIPVSYFAFRVMFDNIVATFGAALLCVMMWHLHLSRTAFMVQTWPFVEVCVLLVVFVALKRRDLWLFAAAGAIAGAGVYTYNAYLLFLPVPVAAIVWAYGRYWREKDKLGLGIISLSLFISAGLIVAASMIQYAHENTFEWRYHQRVVSITSQPEWEDGNLLDQARLLGERAWEWQRGLVWGDREDLGDGLATPGHPPVEPVVFGLAVIGLAMAIWRWRAPEYVVLIVAVFVLPLGAVLTVEDGLFRRTLGLAPFLAVLAGLPLAWAWRRVLAQRPHGWQLYLAGLALVPVYSAVSTTYQYFGPVQDTFAMRYVYPYELDAASRYIARQPDGTLVYFYSDRWPFDYETRRFLAPDAIGVDRSFEFGPPTTELNFGADRSRDVVFVFLGEYLPNFERVVDDFPDGVQTEAVRDGELLYRALFVPGE
jgi:hypothetical protein